MQRDENLLHINNGQHIDAIQLSYRKTGVVYARQSSLLEVTPDQTPIRSRARIGCNLLLLWVSGYVSVSYTAH